MGGENLGKCQSWCCPTGTLDFCERHLGMGEGRRPHIPSLELVCTPGP